MTITALMLAGCGNAGDTRYDTYFAALKSVEVQVINEDKAVAFGERICRIWERDPAAVEQAGTEDVRARLRRVSEAFNVDLLDPIKIADEAEAVAVETLCPETLE